MAGRMECLYRNQLPKDGGGGVGGGGVVGGGGDGGGGKDRLPHTLRPV